MEERGQAQTNDLLAPLDEAVAVAPGDAEHVPVRLYALSVSLQASFTAAITGLGTLGTLNIYSEPTAIWMSRIPPRFRLAKKTLSTA